MDPARATARSLRTGVCPRCRRVACIEHRGDVPCEVCDACQTVKKSLQGQIGGFAQSIELLTSLQEQIGELARSVELLTSARDATAKLLEVEFPRAVGE